MRKWLRSIRGAIGMGLTWAAGWMPIGAMCAFGLWLLGGIGPAEPLGLVWTYAKLFGAFGLVGGGVFSAVLRLTEGRRRFDQLSLPRFATWGGIGGLVMGGLAILYGAGGPGFDLEHAIVIGFATLLGTASAAGTLALARQGDDRELLSTSEDVERVGLSEQERHHLLGPTA